MPSASKPSQGSVPDATAQSLLNLLNFGTSTPPASSARAQEDGTANIPDRSRPTTVDRVPSVSASDLMARFTSPLAASRPSQANTLANHEDQGGGNGGGEGIISVSSAEPDATQDVLLKLLNKAQTANNTGLRKISRERLRPQPTHEDTSTNTKDATAPSQDEVKAVLGQVPTFGATTSESSRSNNAAQQESKPIFTYSNPFQALHDSRSQTPKVDTPKATKPQPQPQPLADPDVAQPSIESDNAPEQENSPFLATAEQVARRRILTPRLSTAGKARSMSREASASFPVPEAQASPLGAKGREVSVAPVSVAVPPQGEAGTSDTNQDANQLSSGENEAEAARAEGGDEWEDADDGEESPADKPQARVVPVYNFPIKPFVSITLQLGSSSATSIRDDGVMEISRLKKEFDQLDRSLAAASSKYITYALVKNGGMRIIRQDDGSDRQVFKNSGDRIFNVALCTTSASGPPTDYQAVLGTGVSGSVYYATILKDGVDYFENREVETESLVFPPYPPADENTAGGVLKTRAKRSSRHPEFFAIGRGKAIHIIWPSTALSSRYGVSSENRRVDVDTYFEDRSLQISTGKAGKDFTFSEDDSLIVSLDKTGRLRFWDIRKLVDESNSVDGRIDGMTVDMPLLSLSTASPAEKSWPTSVLFVDKARPYTRGGPLRYVLVGLRQNHTLQLWDIALGKAVQELNFSHDNETDGICSINYHANSGIIVVGHPTRNSLFFIHLSAPRYTLSSSISQASFVSRVANKDPELPKPDSTACMSGVREISFASKGQLRSVEMLPIYRSSDAQKAIDEKTPLFELYVVHSKGVTCLNITKEDLGWNADSKVVDAIDANKEGLLDIKELRLGSVIEEPPRANSPVEDVQASTKSKKKSKKASAVAVADNSDAVQAVASDMPKPATTQTITNNAPSTAENGDPQTSKETKKSKKKAAPAIAEGAPPKTSSRTASPAKNDTSIAEDSAVREPAVTNAQAMPAAVSNPELPPQVASDSSPQDAVSVGISGDWLDKELKKIEHSVSVEFRKELGTLYHNIEKDRLVQDSSAVARQEAVLRLVSATLTNNVEKSISRILSAQVQQVMVPAITEVTIQAVSAQVGDALTKSLSLVIPNELRLQLPAAVNNALQSPQLTRTISDIISQRVARSVETQLTDVLQKSILPSFQDLARSSAERAASEVEARFRNEMRQLEDDRKHDAGRLEKLSQVLHGMAETLQQMSDTQVAFQGQILKDRRQLAILNEGSMSGGSRQVSAARMTPSPHPAILPASEKPKSELELELDEISSMMNDGRYEEGSIKWLQSKHPVELFDDLFINFTPEYLSTDVSPLIAFSIAITIGNSLATNTARRLEWISTAFNAVNLSVSFASLTPLLAHLTLKQDPEIADLAQHAPALLNSFIAKLESLYMKLAERDPRDPALQIMPLVSRRAKEMRASLVAVPTFGRPNVNAGY